MPLFHFAPMRLREGSIIEPGNFGRVLKATHDHNVVGDMLIRELVFEIVRLSQFPKSPSRLAAAFCCPTQADADRYRQANDVDRRQVLHRVELVDGEAATHTAGLSFLDGQGNPYVPNIEAAAARYWKGEAGAPERGQELLTLSALRVQACLD